MSVDLAKIMELSRTVFLSKTNRLAYNFQKCHEKWTLAPKSVIKGVSQPKLWVVLKILCLHFFPFTLLKKSWGIHFYTRTIFRKFHTLWDNSHTYISCFSKKCDFSGTKNLIFGKNSWLSHTSKFLKILWGERFILM